MKNELKMFRKLLSPDHPACTESEVEYEKNLQSVREGALKIILHVLKNMNHMDLANTLQNSKSFEQWLYSISFTFIKEIVLDINSFSLICASGAFLFCSCSNLR